MIKALITLMALFLVFAASARAQYRVSPTTSKVEQELLDLSKTKWRWMSEPKVFTRLLQ